MEEILSKLVGSVTISLIDKDGKEFVVREKCNLVLDKIYNYMLNSLKPWPNIPEGTPSTEEYLRIEESRSQSIHEIRVGYGHIAEGDYNKPLPPRQTWTDNEASWDNLEDPLENGSAPVIYFEDPSNASTKLSAVFSNAQVNDMYLTEAGLFLKNGEMIAICTFRGIKKTSDFALRITWDLNFK